MTSIIAAFLLVGGWILASLSASPVQGAEPPRLKVGFAETDISPDIGMEQPGGYGKSFHRTFHDACKVRAAVFDDGQKRVALIGVDALMLPRALVEKARIGIQEACGIDPGAVMIAASHSHSSGPTGMVQPGEYDAAPAWVRRLAYEESSCAHGGYLERVRAGIVEAVKAAQSKRVSAELGFGRGHEDKVSFNRRLRMRHGGTWSHPGQGNPEVLGYAGPIDPDVGVMGAWSEDGQLLGCIVNFACHATTNPGGISANWIYYLEGTVRGAMQATSTVVFLPGPCGDITQVDNLSPDRQPAPEDWARRVGGRVGAEAVRALLSAPRTNQVRLEYKGKELQLKRRIPRPERLQAAAQLVEKGKDQADQTAWVFAKELVLLDALLQREPVALVEVQAVQVGPAVFLSSPAEYFVQFGLEQKQRSRFPFTFPVELANGCVGYVPTLEAFGPNGGGYETRLTSYSNLEITAGDQIRDAGIALAHELTPGGVPRPEAAPAFRQPWSYGNVAPELD